MYIYVYLFIHVFIYIHVYIYVCVYRYMYTLKWLTLSLTHADLSGVTLSKLDVSLKIVKAERTKHPDIYIYVCIR